MRIAKVLIFLLSCNLYACAPRELVLKEPVINFEEDSQTKVVTYKPFAFQSEVDPLVIKNLDNNLFKKLAEQKKFKLVKAEEGLKSDFIIAGKIEEFRELLYLDQGNSLYQINNDINQRATTRNFVNLQMSLVGNISILRSDGSILWEQKIDNLELIQLENLTQEQMDSINRKSNPIYDRLKDKVIENALNKFLINLNPYYIYKS